MNESIAGGISGGISSLLTSPLELIKTRIQSNKSQIHQLQTNKNILLFSWQCMRHVVQREGVLSLWKGTTPTLFGSIPSRAIFFGVYCQSKDYFQNLSGYSNSLISSFLGGIVSTTLTSPIWMIKTRMQLDEKKGVVSPLLVLKDVVQKEGVKHLWKGIGASWLGVFETCTQWMILERLKQEQSIPHDSSYILFYSALAKIIATTTWYPHEVIRTRMRERNNKYRNLIHCFLQIMRSESCSALYSGLSIQLLRVVPNFALTATLFDLIIKEF